MKIDKLLGLLVFILSISLLVKYNEDLKINDNTYAYSIVDGLGKFEDNKVVYEKSVVSEENKINTNTLTYKNNNSYEITLNQNDIDINCKATGLNKENDEELAKKGFKVKAHFSYTEDGERFESIKVKRGQSVYIYITNEYSLDEYPTSQVSCDYQLSIIES